MADSNSRLLLGLHKTRIPINPLPNAFRIKPKNTEPPYHGRSLVDDVNTRPHLAPTLHKNLPYDALSLDKRDAAVKNLFVERERTLARNKEEYLSKRSELAEERDRLLLEQKCLKQQSQPPTLADDRLPEGFTFWRNPRNEVIQGSRSLAEVTRQHLASQEAQYDNHKAARAAEVGRRLRPYNGELGPQSYEPWQMEDYFLIRKLVEDMADHVINNYLHLYPPPQGDVETENARREAEDQAVARWMAQVEEGRIVQLTMEELLLQETSTLTLNIAQEIVSLWQMIRTRTDKSFMKTAEKIATGQQNGRERDDPAYDLITKTYFSLEHHRDKFREDVWAHSQPVELTGPAVDSEEQEDSDVLLLEFEHITPMAARQTEARPWDSYHTRVMKQRWADYKSGEATYWKNMTSQLNSVSLNKKTAGVVTARFSPDQQLLALGTAHGDILVYNLTMSPWQPIRTLHNLEKETHDPVIDLAWNAIRTHLISINLSGVLQIWGLHGYRVRSQNDVKRLDLGADSRGVYPEQLTQLLVLDSDRHDLNLQKGPLAEARVHDSNTQYLPDLVMYFPTFTLLGSQSCISVALHNGDVLRLDLELTLRENAEMVTSGEPKTVARRMQFWKRKRNPEDERPVTNQTDRTSLNQNNNANGSRPATNQTNRTGRPPTVQERTPRILNPPLRGMGPASSNAIGQNIQAELYRHHKCSVLLLGFVDNVGDMVTVDLKGYIYIWHYSEASMTSYGWFHPQQKFRMSGSKVMYRATQNVQPNIIFSSQRSDITRKQLGKERERVEGLIEELELKDPWHEETIQEHKLLTQVFLPKEGVSAESGAMFHVITRYQQSKYLYTYMTRLYEPVKVKSTRMLGVRQTPNGDALVFLLLFPEFPPKEYHLFKTGGGSLDISLTKHSAPTITIVIMDLHTMTMRDFNCNLDLSEQQYSRCLHEQVVSFDVSRPLGPTGASYLFLTYTGIFTVISLVSGQAVLKVDNPKNPDPDFVGCRLSGKAISIPVQARIVVSSTPGRITAMLHYHGEEKKLQTQLIAIELTDGSTAGGRRETWNATKRWVSPGVLQTHDRARRVDRAAYSLPSRDNPRAWCLLQVLGCMDRAIQQVDGAFTDQELQQFHLADSTYAYKRVTPQETSLEKGIAPSPTIPPTKGGRDVTTRGSGRTPTEPQPGTSADT